MLEINIAQQTWMFAASLLLGAGMGLLYDLFRIVRVAIPHQAGVIAVEDLVYWTLCTAVTFFFFLSVDDGRIRICLLLGEGIGFTLYYFTIGALLLGAAKRIIAVVRWVCMLIWKWLFQPVIALVRGVLRAGVRLVKWCVRPLLRLGNMLFERWEIKKQAKNAQIHLQKMRKVLYNHNKHFPRLFSKKNRKGTQTYEGHQNAQTQE